MDINELNKGMDDAIADLIKSQQEEEEGELQLDDTSDDMDKGVMELENLTDNGELTEQFFDVDPLLKGYAETVDRNNSVIAAEMQKLTGALVKAVQGIQALIKMQTNNPTQTAVAKSATSIEQAATMAKGNVVEPIQAQPGEALITEGAHMDKALAPVRAQIGDALKGAMTDMNKGTLQNDVLMLQSMPSGFVAQDCIGMLSPEGQQIARNALNS